MLVHVQLDNDMNIPLIIISYHPHFFRASNELYVNLISTLSVHSFIPHINSWSMIHSGAATLTYIFKLTYASQNEHESYSAAYKISPRLLMLTYLIDMMIDVLLVDILTI